MVSGFIFNNLDLFALFVLRLSFKLYTKNMNFIKAQKIILI